MNCTLISNSELEFSTPENTVMIRQHYPGVSADGVMDGRRGRADAVQMRTNVPRIVDSIVTE